MFPNLQGGWTRRLRIDARRLMALAAAFMLLMPLCLAGGAETETQEQSVPETDAREQPVPESYAGSILAGLGVAYAEAYILVTAGGVTYTPIPLLKETDYILRQGEGVENTIHVMPNGVVMAHSTCENQDCVRQGEVTLENRDTRILGNLIICLPHQVQVALYSFDEMEALLAEAFAVSPAAEGNE